MPLYAYLLLAAGWLFWFLPFPLNRWNFKTPETVDRRARWGLFLEIVAYALLWQTDFWARTPSPWRLTLSLLFLACGALLSWTGVRALGRHLRFDAAIGQDHELVRSGAYRIVRHPIYASMLCMLLGTGFLITPLPLLLLAVLVFVAGTEVRIRAEEKLLAARFGDQFRDYRRHVPAYFPPFR